MNLADDAVVTMPLWTPMLESSYTLYVHDIGIATSPSLEQIKALAKAHLREGREPRIRLPGGLFLRYDTGRKDWVLQR
jgi:hypothetical protein